MIITDSLLSYWNSKKGVSGAVWNNIAPNTNPLSLSLINVENTEQGIYFNGSGGYVRLFSPVELRTKGQSYSIEILLTPAIVEESSTELFSYTTYTSFDVYGLWSEHFEGDSWTESVGHWTNYPFQINTLTQIVITYDAENKKARYFINGAQASEIDVVNHVSWSYGSGEIYIGKGDSDSPLVGYMHALRLYSKALTLEDVETNYNNGIEIGIEEGGDPDPDPDPDPGELPVGVLARITADGKLIILGKVVEGSEIISFKPNGDLHVGEVILGVSAFSFNGNKIYANEIIEGGSLDF